MLSRISACSFLNLVVSAQLNDSIYGGRYSPSVTYSGFKGKILYQDGQDLASFSAVGIKPLLLPKPYYRGFAIYMRTQGYACWPAWKGGSTLTISFMSPVLTP
ncbi:hypothetical protein K432DRAFT_448500 [Lepidopterella palustris CBS 459.81]|uniref:Uncharacterized protein n=1 Tax=Lepidopterella palustris CBS 459.81 TaxID=1314670 RepID=A0A8E2JGS6_9PEZI|nr:hypothetical protein K432DRAFT_448500 [Lepidopterella palustris CBS 459.81]